MKFRSIYRTFILTILSFIVSSTQAQEIPEKDNKFYFVFNSAVSVPYAVASENLNVGGIVSGDIYYKLSKSFDLGIELSDQFNSGKDNYKNLQQFSANSDVVWHPSALFRSVDKDKVASSFGNLYLSIGFGHSFSSSADNIIFNNLKQSLGYKMPLKNQNNIHFQLNRRDFTLKKLPSATSHQIFAFIEASIGYGF